MIDRVRQVDRHHQVVTVTTTEEAEDRILRLVAEIEQLQIKVSDPTPYTGADGQVDLASWNAARRRAKLRLARASAQHRELKTWAKRRRDEQLLALPDGALATPMDVLLAARLLLTNELKGVPNDRRAVEFVCGKIQALQVRAEAGRTLPPGESLAAVSPPLPISTGG